MTGTVVAPKFATWSAPGHPLRIEYSQAVLEEIRQIAVEGYLCVPHGGVETGGVLFGTHHKSVVRIKAWRPIACEYAKGPSFLLSEKEEAGLVDALQSWRGDAGLARLEPVGWYRAHTRSEILLSEADLNFFNRFFAQPWQIGLIVRPGSFTPTRAGFFFREADGKIRAQSSYREFTLTPVTIAEPAVAEAAVAGRAVAPPAIAQPAAPEGVSPIPEAPPAAPVPVPPPPLARIIAPAAGTPRNSSVRWKWYAASLGVLAVALLGFWLL